MNSEAHSTSGILVPLDEQIISRLLSLRHAGESLADVIDRLCSCEDAAVDSAAMHTAPETMAGKYEATFLGETVSANTLPALFSRIVDMVAEINPAALERLANMKARTRRYVSRTKEAVHPGRADLPVLQTRSGWWISANVGREDIARSLRALAEAAGLTFGRDIRFPAGKG